MELTLEGLSTTDIARRFYHAPSPVDAYLHCSPRS